MASGESDDTLEEVDETLTQATCRSTSRGLKSSGSRSTSSRDTRVNVQFLSSTSEERCSQWRA